MKSNSNPINKSIILTSILTATPIDMSLPNPEELLIPILQFAFETNNIYVMKCFACIANHIGSDKLEEKVIENQINSMNLNPTIVNLKIWVNFFFFF